ncbi:MAG: GNAT family N-acetyltransferase [Chloroflexi bacterium]|nr:GNAT family N-acetyltransferase [Chloroflexota bacterium]
MIEAEAGRILATALEVFARGICVPRSFTHPCLAERVEGLWVTRDAPRKRGSYRREEWVAHGVTPDQTVEVVSRHTRGRYAICAICAAGSSDESMRAGYRALDHRLGFTEPIMVHDLQGIPRFASPVEIVRVLDAELASKVNKAVRRRQILLEHLTPDAPLRMYAALVDGNPAGWVSSIEVAGATWCANLHVTPEFRRRGIGRALMCRMLRDDRSHGSQLAVLAASHTGAMLYPLVGYEQVGMLYSYTPRRR